MTAITITEALAEIKLIDKRIQSKREFLAGILLRQEMIKDPLEKQGGSVEAIKRERQAIADLLNRKIAIRMSIQGANEQTVVIIDGESRSIAAWLVWRREVLPTYQAILSDFRSRVQATRNDAQRKGLAVVTTADVATKGTDIIVNFDEAALASEIEHLETVVASLDGQLSLKNATVLVEV